MNEPIKLDLDAIEAAAKAATPQDFDSAEEVFEGGYITCPGCDGEGMVAMDAEYLNYDNEALGVQFYGVGDAHVNSEAYYRAAKPSVVLELIRRLRAAEGLAQSRIQEISTDTQILAIFADIAPEHRGEAEEFTKAIQARCGRRTLVAYFPTGCDVTALDDEAMGKVGWVRK